MADEFYCFNCGVIELENGRCPYCRNEHVVPEHRVNVKPLTGIEKHFLLDSLSHVTVP